MVVVLDMAEANFNLTFKSIIASILKIISVIIGVIMDLNKRCKHCGKSLTTENAAKKNALYFRNECKSCRSFHVTQRYKGDENKKQYMKTYHEKNKELEFHECLTCKKLCIKKYEFAFCSDICRFMSHVTKTEACWNWNSSKDGGGYGQTNIGSEKIKAHRLSYELFKGEITDNLLVCHGCDNPSCVNPEHLWLGTNKDNMKDMHDKGRIYTKLSPYQITKMRQLWKDGSSSKEICEKYGVTSGHLSNIVNRKIWKHI